MTLELKWFVANDKSWAAEPFSMVTPDRIHWSVATDRTWIVAVKGPGKLSRCKAPGKSFGDLISMLRLKPDVPIEIPVNELKKFAGEPSETFNNDDDPSGVFGGVQINLKRLARLLQGVEEENVRVWIATKQVQKPCLGFETDAWKALLAGYSEIDEETPAFDLRSSSQKLFDLAMTGESESLLTG